MYKNYGYGSWRLNKKWVNFQLFLFISFKTYVAADSKWNLYLYDYYLFFFFNCYLAAPRPTLGHYRGGSLTHPILITSVLNIRPEVHRELLSGVGSLSPAERLVGFEPETFRFWSQRLNPIGHSPHYWFPY